MTFEGIFSQGFCLEVPFPYGFDEFLDDLHVGSGMKGQASCPLEIIPFRRSGLVFVNDIYEGLVAADDGIFTLYYGVSVLFVSVAFHDDFSLDSGVHDHCYGFSVNDIVFRTIISS